MKRILICYGMLLKAMKHSKINRGLIGIYPKTYYRLVYLYFNHNIFDVLYDCEATVVSGAIHAPLIRNGLSNLIPIGVWNHMYFVTAADI